ncbi:hypothetical protein [Bacillus tropicus]|uniref:hypothetical protein n=1 Tax=Bacillus tropicus TaxID=2026188 RepID=UPI000B449DCA|nr:hypothetical protein [Bacillus tropicus]MED2996949.1 hypothetical protein [Bacillus tropicus]OTY54772.1 hypothetical protein BK748_17375 [Bacillus thuringiensis serovar graciosensis]
MFGWDRNIGDHSSEFLFNYHDWNDVFNFCVTSMSVANEIKRKETGKGMFEDLFPEVKTYTLYEMNGKKYLQNNQTGEINTVKNLDQDI